MGRDGSEGEGKGGDLEGKEGTKRQRRDQKASPFFILRKLQTTLRILG
jgi:hypothetical protein